MRIKLSKLLVKTMPSGDEKWNFDSNGKAKILLPRRIQSILRKSLGEKKSKEVNPSGENDNNTGTTPALGGPREAQVAAQALSELEIDGTGLQKVSRKPRLSISRSIKRMLESRGKFNGEKDSDRSVGACTQAFKTSFGKNFGFNPTKGNMTGDAGDACLVREKVGDNHAPREERKPKILPRVSNQKSGNNGKIKRPEFH